MKAPYITLNNAVKIPQLGLGVWQIEDGPQVELATRAAFEVGYRLVDTAAVYGNEIGVGRAVAYAGLPREEIFITTKLWNADQGYDSAFTAFDKSLMCLGLDYVDLYLIHWPVPEADKYVETWRAMEELYASGKAKAIGVSNFAPEQLEHLLASASVVPAVNQIELHPRKPQYETREFCAAHGIAVESWSPLGGTRNGDLRNDPTIEAIGEAHGKSPAQVIIRWHLQQGLIVIPKSARPARIAENFNVFDFELTGKEMATIDALGTAD